MLTLLPPHSFLSPEPTPIQRRRDTICVLKDQISRLQDIVDAESDGEDDSSEEEKEGGHGKAKREEESDAVGNTPHPPCHECSGIQQVACGIWPRVPCSCGCATKME